MGNFEQARDVSAHLINLQVLGPLLESQILQELSTEFTFGSPVNVTLPNLTIYSPQEDHKLSAAFRTLGLQTIHLTTAINQSLQMVSYSNPQQNMLSTRSIRKVLLIKQRQTGIHLSTGFPVHLNL